MLFPLFSSKKCFIHPSRKTFLTKKAALFILETQNATAQTKNDLSRIENYLNSVKTLQARFKESTGYTLHKFFLNIKIRSAIDLLKKGHTVSEVSDMLGFCNSNYFSQVFRRETGKNPGSFK